MSTTPEFIRLPKQGSLCPHTGLSRAYLYDLITNGLIKSISLKKRGESRGVRLIVYSSLRDYIYGKPEVSVLDQITESPAYRAHMDQEGRRIMKELESNFPFVKQK